MISIKVSFRVLRQKKLRPLLTNTETTDHPLEHSKNDIVKRSLDSLHGDFTIEATDTTNGNTAIICKSFYMRVLIKELGIDNKFNTNSTFKYLPNTNKVVLISSHSNFILINLQQNVMMKINVYGYYTSFLN